jgi:hypothetical protein
VVTAGVLIPLREHSLLVTIPLALGIYAVMALLLRAVSPADLRALAGVMRPRGTRLEPPARVHEEVA